MAILAAGAWLAFASPALGVGSAERSAARQLAQQGVEAYQAEDYEKALDRLERAYQTLPTPALALWCARALEKLGRWVEAAELYLQATRIPIDRQGDTRVQEDARQEAATARERLIKRIPTLVVEVDGGGEDLVVKVGNQEVGSALIGADLPTDPGTVRITAQSGGQMLEREVQLSEGQREVVTLRFDSSSPKTATSPAPAAATSATPEDQKSSGGGWRRPAGWIAIGLGAVALGVGAGFGLDAIAKRDASAADCDDSDVCGPDGTDLRNAGLTSAAVSTATFTAGGVLAAGGIVLLLTAPKQSPHTALHLVPTFGGAGLSWRGQF